MFLIKYEKKIKIKEVLENDDYLLKKDNKLRSLMSNLMLLPKKYMFLIFFIKILIKYWVGSNF